MIDSESLPSGDVPDQGPSEQELLDAVMANSPIMDEIDVPLPTEEVSEEVPEESEEDPETEEAVSEDDEEEVEEEGEVDEADDSEELSTQDDVLTPDDLDLDAQLSLKIDGEEVTVSFGDLVKGYSTEQSLSKKGRELGEARQYLEAEREEKLAELNKISAAAGAVLGNNEQLLSKQYHAIEAKITKARDEGDTYEVNELKDKREQVQKQYWTARKNREGLMEAVDKRQATAHEEQFKQQMQHFAENIPDLIPDFSEKVAEEIRTFALEEGIADGLLGTVTDPSVVKFIDDYRRLKQGVSKGTAKRKAVTAKKALPTRKAKTPATKKKTAAASRRTKALSEGSSRADQDAFLRDYANNSLNNL